MKIYTSVEVLFLNFSDLQSVIRTFNVHHKAQLQQYPMPWLIKTWKTIQSLPWCVKQLPATQSQNFPHSFLKYLSSSDFTRDVPYDNTLSKPLRFLGPTTKEICKHSEKEIRGSLDVWEVNNEVTQKKYWCEVQVISLTVLTLWARYNLLNIWKVIWITMCPLWDGLGMNWMRKMEFWGFIYFGFGCFPLDAVLAATISSWNIKLRQWWWASVQARTCNSFCQLPFISKSLAPPLWKSCLICRGCVFSRIS